VNKSLVGFTSLVISIKKERKNRPAGKVTERHIALVESAKKKKRREVRKDEVLVGRLINFCKRIRYS
jgi:hypothetical protein